MLAAELQLRRREQSVDDHVIAANAIIHELAIAFRTDDPQRGQLALRDAGRKLNEYLASVVEGAERPPGRVVALDAVAKVERVEVDAGGDGRCGFRGCILLAQRD